MAIITKSRVFCLVYLSLFSMLGVITRLFLQQFFIMGCSGTEWGPCLIGGVYFKDLVANMLGSFIIGIAAAPSAIGLLNDKPVAILREDHPWQRNLHLQLGIRTGYCGSLTTFSSWIVEVMSYAINDNSWANAVIEIIIGFVSAIFSYMIGVHIVLYTDRWILSSPEDVIKSQEDYKSFEVDAYRSGATILTPDQVVLAENQPDLPRNAPSFKRRGTDLNSSNIESLLEVEEEGMVHSRDGQDDDDHHHHHHHCHDGGFTVATHGNSRRDDPEDGDVPSQTAVAAEQQTLPPPASTANVAATAAAAAMDRPQRSLIKKTDVFALVLFVLLTIGCTVGVVFETQYFWLRKIWLSSLMGPFGCILRWQLSKFNYTLQGGWNWYPAGTFAANTLGTAISLGMAVILARVQGISYWGNIVVQSVQAGYCGALTTVSTFVTEVVKFSEFIPDNSRSYIYVVMTFGVAIALAIAEYGWTKWA